MELRERVARILCEQGGFDPDGGPKVGYGWINYTGNADTVIAAVLNALQEPSETMVEIGTKSTFTPVDGQDAELVWSNMLAAFRTEALGEG